jgi:hypothetical protein
MYARTSTWTGDSEGLERWVDHVTDSVAGMGSGLPGNAGALFLRRSGRRRSADSRHGDKAVSRPVLQRWGPRVLSAAQSRVRPGPRANASRGAVFHSIRPHACSWSDRLMSTGMETINGVAPFARCDVLRARICRRGGRNDRVARRAGPSPRAAVRRSSSRSSLGRPGAVRLGPLRERLACVQQIGSDSTDRPPCR